MKNIERQPDEQIDYIPGNYTDIYLGNPTEWQAFLDSKKGYREMYYGNEDDLPSPITTARVCYYPESVVESEIDNFTLVASLEFSPAALTETTEQPWQIAFTTDLRNAVESAGFLTHTLPHELGAFHARVSSHHSARVSTWTEPNRCIVSVSIGEVEPEDDADNERTDKFVGYKNGLSIWSQAIDTTVDLYSLPGSNDHRQHHIALDITDPTDKIRKQITQLADKRNGMLDNSELVDKNITTFDDIAGYDEIKTQLLDLALLNKYSGLASDIGLTSTHGILLHGAPGTAKTMLLKAFANEINATLEEVSVSKIIEKYVGSSARNLDKYFEKLVQRPEKIVVLMDEFDSIGVDGDRSSTSERTDTVNRLKEWVINIGENHHNIILTGATNNIDYVDKALIRPGRFLSIEVPIPNEHMRKQIWSMMLGKIGVRAVVQGYDNPNGVNLNIADDINTDILAQRTYGMVGAHFTEILNAIRMQRLRTYDQTKRMHPITQDELLEQIQKTVVED